MGWSDGGSQALSGSEPVEWIDWFSLGATLDKGAVSLIDLLEVTEEVFLKVRDYHGDDLILHVI